eukprot:TRINITY_DN2502_c0_g1_i1.p2 TRINITY_DN2502_c0_g1~~TRINITY_DN2502_c0_g1_i1.p2  ORF type:complete len:347 (-),score=108.88 TRINITY_DN2502_c0_g1_i1:847-1887(-)
MSHLPGMQNTPNKPQKSPRAVLLLHKGVVGPRLITDTIHTKNLLQLKGIAEDEIEVRELDSAQIGAQGLGDGDWPLIQVEGTHIGGVSDLESWIISGQINTLLHEEFNPLRSFAAFEQRLSDVRFHKELLQGELQKAQQQNRADTVDELQCSIVQLDKSIASISNFLQQVSHEPEFAELRAPHRLSPPPSRATLEPYALVSTAYETGASLLSGVSSVLSSYFAAWASAGGHAPPRGSPRKLEESLKDFDVIQVNWYWRQQPRTLRFFADKFQRVNAATGEVRSEHSYSAIQLMTVTGRTFLQLVFKDASPAEYYQAASVPAIAQLIIDVAVSPPNFYDVPVKRVTQ